MIEYIKSLPTPILIVSGIIIYILIGMLVSFIAGLADDGSEDLIAIGVLWIFVLPLMALFGVLWIFIAPFKLGAKINKPKISDEEDCYDDDLRVNELYREAEDISNNAGEEKVE